jgi:hypothetical protein
MALIHEGMRLLTGPDGHLYVKTVDKGFISLRPNSELSIETYRYDPALPSATRIKLLLHKGVMRSISGKGAESARDQFRLNTPLAAIGIRGTDFSTFTDASTTRVSVRRGGVVMAPFVGSCEQVGSGPCEGDMALDLTAGRAEAMLLLRSGDPKPKLVKQKHLLPDKVSPPLNEEGSRSDNLGKASEHSPSAAEMHIAENLSGLPMPPAAVEPLMVSWGRWQQLADLPAGESLASFRARVAGDLTALNRSFVMSRAAQPHSVMPVNGSFDFMLRGYEAYLVNDASRTAVAATVTNAVLNIDFGRQRFATSLDVHAGDTGMNVKARGSILADGQMVGDRDYSSNTAIDGMVAGSKGTQAGYVFNRRADERGVSAVGATVWAR